MTINLDSNKLLGFRITTIGEKVGTKDSISAKVGTKGDISANIGSKPIIGSKIGTKAGIKG